MVSLFTYLSSSAAGNYLRGILDEKQILTLGVVKKKEDRTLNVR